MSHRRLTVFVSSSMEELADERRVVKNLLERRDIGGWLFEVDGDAREHSIRETSLREVEAADLYIGLFWRKYGEVTAAEYEHARRMGKSCLIFEKRTDLEPGRESGLRDFLGRVGQIDRGVTVSWFTTLGDLEDKVTRSVSGWVADTVRGRADAKVAGVYGVAPLPAHYVARDGVAADLRRYLLSESATTAGILTLTAVRGLGGVGKSTLVRALCHEPAVRRRYPDGILWAELNQEPNLLERLTEWLEVLGDAASRPTSVSAATTRLRVLLDERAVLLVVDNVWQAMHVEPFRVTGARGRLVVTTRRADVAQALGGDVHLVDVMSEKEALALFSARLGGSLGDEDAARAVAEAVGYLPLALDMVAARAAHGIGWASLRQALGQASTRLALLDSPESRWRNADPKLAACFELSLGTLRQELAQGWEAFVWFGLLPGNVSITARLCATLWDMSEDDAGGLLARLADESLLTPDQNIIVAGHASPAYRLHDLLRDYASSLLCAPMPRGLGIAADEAHRRLLRRYSQRLGDGRWSGLPDDGYIHSHVLRHMEAAGDQQRIHILLA
jgi:hypothetical protein